MPFEALMPCFSRMRRHLLLDFLCFHTCPFTFPSPGCRCGRSQPPNPFQNGPEQLSRDRHLRHLEDDLPGMAHDLRPDLDQFAAKDKPLHLWCFDGFQQILRMKGPDWNQIGVVEGGQQIGFVELHFPVECWHSIRNGTGGSCCRIGECVSSRMVWRVG